MDAFIRVLVIALLAGIVALAWQSLSQSDPQLMFGVAAVLGAAASIASVLLDREVRRKKPK